MKNFGVTDQERYEKIVEQNAIECWDEEQNDFDWDRYQYLSDCCEYWYC